MNMNKRKYIVFGQSGYNCIEMMKVDFLKLKVMYPNQKLEWNKKEYKITCDLFEVRYIHRFLTVTIDDITPDEVDGVYDCHLLYGLNANMHDKLWTLDGNEFLTWLREGDLVNEFINR